MKFDKFLTPVLGELLSRVRETWKTKVRTTEREDLPAYQRQMSILSSLDPGTYGETRVPVLIQQTPVGVIHEGRYYLIPICAGGTELSPDVSTVRAQIAQLMAASPDVPPAQLTDGAGCDGQNYSYCARDFLTLYKNQRSSMLQSALQTLHQGFPLYAVG